MTNYTAKLDHGQGGTTMIAATDANLALAEAVKWAEAGDWKGQAEVLVEVFADDQKTPAAETVITVGE